MTRNRHSSGRLDNAAANCSKISSFPRTI
jgi:hypothetical protein